MNELIKKILKQQSYLRSHIDEIKNKEENIERFKKEKTECLEGKEYIMENFLTNAEHSIEDIISHDSGIGKGFSRNTNKYSMVYFQN